jgi:hypothetical protein
MNDRPTSRAEEARIAARNQQPQGPSNPAPPAVRPYAIISQNFDIAFDQIDGLSARLDAIERRLKELEERGDVR